MIGIAFNWPLLLLFMASCRGCLFAISAKCADRWPGHPGNLPPQVVATPSLCIYGDYLYNLGDVHAWIFQIFLLLPEDLSVLTDVWFVIAKGSRRLMLSDFPYDSILGGRSYPRYTQSMTFVKFCAQFSISKTSASNSPSLLGRNWRFPVWPRHGNVMIMLLIMGWFYRKHLNWIMSPKSAEIDAAARWDGNFVGCPWMAIRQGDRDEVGWLDG